MKKSFLPSSTINPPAGSFGYSVITAGRLAIAAIIGTSLLLSFLGMRQSVATSARPDAKIARHVGDGVRFPTVNGRSLSYKVMEIAPGLAAGKIERAKIPAGDRSRVRPAEKPGRCAIAGIATVLALIAGRFLAALFHGVGFQPQGSPEIPARAAREGVSSNPANTHYLSF